MKRAALLCFAIAGASLVLGVVRWTRDEQMDRRTKICLSVEATVAVPIYGSHAGTQSEAAANLLSETIAASTGIARSRFTFFANTRPDRDGFRIAVRPGESAPLDRTVGYDISSHEVTIWARHEVDLPAAVSWFLERRLGARWFMPGKLGAEIPKQRRLVLAPAAESFTPGYISRDFYFYSAPAPQWAEANRLVRVFDHGHNLNVLFQPEDFRRQPEMAPIILGQRFSPAPTRSNWQPDLNAPATLALAKAKLREKLRAPRPPVNVVLGQNDSWRWDQSAATAASVSPLRYFRNRPDYSDAWFGFLNRVAADLSRDFPPALIATYAYDWTEQVPRQSVHPNILPFLTADRSQWFDPKFRAEDQDLIRRWAAAGPRVFGLYDYFYGAPFLVPRPTLYAVTDPIPFAHQQGARAYYAETHPNWALDGPKLWLAAQLLWDPTRPATALLDDYYARFWQEAAPAMRSFFERCDDVYLKQPPPAYWLKFYKDEHQTSLFPPAVRDALQADLARATTLARSARIRERVEFVRRAFAVSDAFCRYNEARDRLSTMLLRDTFDADALRAALMETTRTRHEFLTLHSALRRAEPLAIATQLPDNYLRNDPRPRAMRRLAELGAAPPLDAELAATWFTGRLPSSETWRSFGPEKIGDSLFASVRVCEAHPFASHEWTARPGSWNGVSEPVESRRIDIIPEPSGFRTLRFSGASEGGIYQAVTVEPGALYRATVQVRGRVSPGNLSALFLVFADQANRADQPGIIDRLPIGRWDDWTKLELIVRAPPHARNVTFGLLTNRQAGDDFVEFRQPSLQRLPEQ